jgi:peroxiredoxin
MKQVFLFSFLFLPFSFLAQSHRIEGSFPRLKGSWLSLHAFQGLQSKVIDSAQVDSDGYVCFSFSADKLGLGYIQTRSKKAFPIAYVDSLIQLENDSPSFTQIHVKNGINTQVLAGQSHSYNALHSYMSWYLPFRKWIHELPYLPSVKPSEVPAALASAQALHPTDPRLFTSGLLAEALERYLWLAKINASSPAQAQASMTLAIDTLLARSVNHPTLYQELTQFLFQTFEKNFWNEASEYLANQALSQDACQLPDRLTFRLESYRKMKVGLQAPDIHFQGNLWRAGEISNGPTRLSEVEKRFKLLLFGASWCQMCKQEIARILPRYDDWQSKGLEVIFISLDGNPKAFQTYVQDLPFLSACDFKQTQGKAAQDYYISSSPTMFLLNQENKILYRPISASNVDEWLQLQTL